LFSPLLPPGKVVARLPQPLTSSQKAAIALEVEDIYRVEAKERQRESPGRPPALPEKKGVAILPYLLTASEKAAMALEVEERYRAEAGERPERHQERLGRVAGTLATPTS
jgi:hypothetical protein